MFLEGNRGLGILGKMSGRWEKQWRGNAVFSRYNCACQGRGSGGTLVLLRMLFASSGIKKICDKTMLRGLVS